MDGACMLPMVAIAVWLGTAPDAVHSHYLHALGARALGDQHLAATIMWAGGLPRSSHCSWHQD